MYVNVKNLEATGENVVVKMLKWPTTFTSTTIVIPEYVNNSYDNGRELYLGEVFSSNDEKIKKGDFIAVDIFFGVHVPSEVRTEKIKIIPASGVVLKSSKKLNVMSDIVNMEPGKDRLFLKIRKKEAITAGGIIIPDVVISQDPTAEDIRIAEVVKADVEGFSAGDVVVLEAYAGKGVYLNADKELYLVCYATDVLAKITT